jgi:cytoskeleton protein RodZ
MPVGMRVGSDLKAARKNAGISLDVIAERTKVKVSKLVALEEADFKNLPAGFYLLTLVRAYAGEVHIDPEPIVERLRAEFAEKDELDALHALDATGALASKQSANARKSPEERSSLFRIVAAAFLVALIAAAGTGAYLYRKNGTTPEEVRSTNVNVETASVPLSAPAPATTDATAIDAPQQAAREVHPPTSTKNHRPKPRIAARRPAPEGTVATSSDVSDAPSPGPERTEEPADKPADVEEVSPAP